MGIFNTREIASAIWLAVFAIWALSKPDIRKSVWAVVKAFFHVKILVPILLIALYTAGAASLLNAFGLWDMALLKDTILWFFMSALSIMMRLLTSRRPKHALREVVADSLKVIILFEFLVNTYTFPLIGELLLLPVLALLAMVSTYAEAKGEKQVSSLIGGAQAFIGLVILAVAGIRALNDLHILSNPDTLRSFLLAPELSLLSLPLLYTMALVSVYEQVFLRIDLGREKDAELKRYARCQVIRYAGLSLDRLQSLLGHAGQIMTLGSTSDVDCLIQEVRDKAG